MTLTHSPKEKGEADEPVVSMGAEASTGGLRSKEPGTNRALPQGEASSQTWKMIKENKNKEVDELDKLLTGSKSVKGCETCSKCLKKVKNNQMGVICDYCHVWFHNECVNINRGEYKMLSELEDKVKWYCDRCYKHVDGVQQENAEMKQENIFLKKQNQELTVCVEHLKEEMRKMEKKLDSLEGRLDSKIDRRINNVLAKKEENILRKVNEAHLKYEEHLRVQVKQLGMDTAAEIRKSEQRYKQQKFETDQLEHIKKEVMEGCLNALKELNQKEEQDEGKELETSKTKDRQMKDIAVKLENLERGNRKNNLVIYNLQESSKMGAGQRYEEDRKHIQKIFTQELLRDGFSIERITRLGKRTEEGRRPILVEMRTEKEKMDILVNAKRMRNSVEYPKLYINKDLTVNERIKEKQLREQLRDRRNNGEKDCIIRNGKIVSRSSNLSSQDTDENNNSEVPVPTNFEVPEDEEGAVGGARRKTTRNFH